MTTHYFDITLLPDPEFSSTHLMEALLSKLHRALVHLQTSKIGVSFPNHVNQPGARRGLGDTVRLHGTAPSLEQLNAMEWLKGMREHVIQGPLAQIPELVTHRLVRRRQFKTNVERLRRRRMRRKGETIEQATAAIPREVERQENLPFVNMRSTSSGHRFALFIEHGPELSAPLSGDFNTYGLSLGATIPWF